MKIIGVIPARYRSSRFEGKPLALICGKPMIIHVAEQVQKAVGKESTYVATDDHRIIQLVESHGYKCVMTSESCLTGTDRLWEVAQKVQADIYVNIQGDEPMISPLDIERIINEKKRNMESVVNGMLPLSGDEDPGDINIPKVLVNKDDRLIYMSRLPIPGLKDDKKRIDRSSFLKQVCIYGFSYCQLKAFGTNGGKADYEDYEDIEILRFMDLSVPIKMVMMAKSTIAVDRPEDVVKVEKALQG
ncbi:3-deoxy-manno-octulosonate cytidylyltransferase [Akkermansiaceae bacterium]|nr:3-deoxy-manno-octulosonate cytidylyltransferase [Akkermansiaceae bacterium]